jgi:hypothetical protein
MQYIKSSADVYPEGADELLSKGDVVQASEKYRKAAEEAFKILSYENSVNAVSKVNEIGHWNSRPYFDTVQEFNNLYHGIKSL